MQEHQFLDGGQDVFCIELGMRYHNSCGVHESVLGFSKSPHIHIA